MSIFKNYISAFCLLALLATSQPVSANNTHEQLETLQNIASILQSMQSRLFGQVLGVGIVTVTTDAEFESAVANAEGGDTILVAPGDYQGFDITKQYSSVVTIKSADSGNPARFMGRSETDGARNIVFDDLIFQSTHGIDAPSYLWTNRFQGTDLVVKNSHFIGTLNDQGAGIGHGLQVPGESENVLIENNLLENFHYGMVSGGTRNITFRDNEIRYFSADAIQMVSVEDILIDGNFIHEPRRDPTSGVHVDMIQIFNSGKTFQTNNVTIRDNIFDVGPDGEISQYIFMGNEAVRLDGAGEEMYYKDITIENNIIYGVHSAGISIGEADGLTIRNNTVLHVDGGPDGLAYYPVIKTKYHSIAVTIENNVAYQVTDNVNNRSDWTLNNNFTIDPSEYSDHFVGSSMTSSDPHDFKIKNTSPFYNYGSTLMDRESGGSTPVPDDCSFNGQSIAHTANVTAYAEANVAYGSQCVSQQRSCSDGSLSGSYQYDSCEVAPAPDPVPDSTSIVDASHIVSSSDNFATDHEPANLFDGCTSTVDGCSMGTSQSEVVWVEFDLGQYYDLEKAEIFGDTNGTWVSRTWTIEYKDVDGEYQDIFRDRGIYGNRWYEQGISAVARYVRLTVTGTDGSGKVQAMEFTLDGTPGTAPSSDPDTSSDSSGGDSSDAGDGSDSDTSSDSSGNTAVLTSVVTTDNVAVRATAAGTRIGRQSKESIGLADLDKTIFQDGYTWLYVDFVSGKDGYVAKEFLAVTSSPADPSGSDDVSTTGDDSATQSRVQATDNIKVRASADGSRIGRQSQGALGVSDVNDTVVKGGYTWVYVNFDSGVDGYVAQQYLVVVQTFSDTNSAESSASVSEENSSTVSVNENIAVRASVSGDRLGRQVTGSTGQADYSKKVSSGGYTWVYVNFDSGVDGYVASEFLTVIATAESAAFVGSSSGDSASESVTAKIELLRSLVEQLNALIALRVELYGE